MLACTVLIAATMILRPARAQSEDELVALDQRVIALYSVGKYAEAIPLVEQYAGAVRTRAGENDPNYDTALNNLAELLRLANRLNEAEPLMRRALAIDEEILDLSTQMLLSS
jgi:tetratricopeptide (TPR) repeat protein